jgi:hypothetical protein
MFTTHTQNGRGWGGAEREAVFSTDYFRQLGDHQIQLESGPVGSENEKRPSMRTTVLCLLGFGLSISLHWPVSQSEAWVFGTLALIGSCRRRQSSGAREAPWVN